MQEKISCRGCKFYKITWDPQFPYGCDALGFKTAKNPAQVVYESSGMPCQFYQRKSFKDNREVEKDI